ncbi:MAG: hypothetical protein ACLFUI_00195 [Halanaerobiales bacterium]
MDRIKKHIYFHYKDFKKGVLVFWAIVFALFFIFTLGAQIYDISLAGNRDTFTVNTFSAIIIVLIISTYEVMNYSFPHLIGISSTRKDYWLGKTCFFLILAIALAAVQGLMLILEYSVLPFNEVTQGLKFLSGEANFFTMLFRFIVFNISSFFLTTAIFSLFFTIAYRLEKIFYIFLGFISALIVLVLPYFSAEVVSIEDSISIVIETVVRSLIIIVETNFAFSTSLYYLLLSIPLFFAEYLVLRKTEVK